MDNKAVVGMITLTAFITYLAGGLITDDGTPYFCEARDSVCIGSRLSETGKTCYYLVDGTEKGVRCMEGWTVYNSGTSKPDMSVEIWANNCLHTCDYTDTLKSYDLCYCDNGQWAYVGELV
jgi:hypothetical protein